MGEHGQERSVTIGFNDLPELEMAGALNRARGADLSWGTRATHEGFGVLCGDIVVAEPVAVTTFSAGASPPRLPAAMAAFVVHWNQTPDWSAPHGLVSGVLRAGDGASTPMWPMGQPPGAVTPSGPSGARLDVVWVQELDMLMQLRNVSVAVTTFSDASASLQLASATGALLGATTMKSGMCAGSSRLRGSGPGDGSRADDDPPNEPGDMRDEKGTEQGTELGLQGFGYAQAQQAPNAQLHGTAAFGHSGTSAFVRMGAVQAQQEEALRQRETAGKGMKRMSSMLSSDWSSVYFTALWRIRDLGKQPP